MRGYQQWLQVSVGLVLDCFQCQTDIAAFDIGLNIFLKAWPIVFLANKLFYFIDIKMICQKIVVVPADELYLNDFRYK